MDDIWLKAPEQRGFLQRSPEQGLPATNDTRYYILYDKENIYFLFIMLDRNSRSIPARLVERDYQFYPDDSINFLLDTYHDNRKAFYFCTNPLGVQQDGLISENGENVDMTWDGIFKVGAQVNKYGWVAEFAIPFKTLRFKDDLKYQIWGFNAWRIRKQSREVSYWSLVDQNYGMFRLDKTGILVGMKNVQSGRHLNFLPYITGRHTASRFASDEFDNNAGLDLKYNINSDLILDLTLNPDFGQVEIDEEQINLDKRYEIQLEERRPFFLENTNLFQSPFYQLFYSRRIGAQSDIKGGAKLSGKIGPYSVGAMEVLTGDWGNYGLGVSDSGATDELFSVIRVQQDILNSSNVGVMLVDREANMGGSNNRSNLVGGLDWSIYSGKKYFIGQAVYALNAFKDTTFDINTGLPQQISQLNQKGSAFFAQTGHYGQLFWLDVHANYYEPEFDIDNTGYFQKLPGKGKKQTGIYADVHPLINTKFIRSWGVSVAPTIMKDSDESKAGFGVQNTAWVETPDQSQFKIGFSSYRDVETYFLDPSDELTYWGRDWFAQITTDPGKQVSLELRGSFDSQYYFQTHTTGYNRGIEGSLYLKPLSNAYVELNYQRRWFLDRDLNQLPTELYGQTDVQIAALRTRYLFSRTIFSRGFLQWTNGAEQYAFVQDVNTGGYQLKYQVGDRISANVLLGWRFKPGSTLYLAYTQQWDNLIETKLFSMNRIFFFKLSYLWSI